MNPNEKLKACYLIWTIANLACAIMCIFIFDNIAQRVLATVGWIVAAIRTLEVKDKL